MPSARLEITQNALKDLKRLDKATARRILSKLEANIALPDPLLRAKPLQGKLEYFVSVSTLFTTCYTIANESY